LLLERIAHGAVIFLRSWEPFEYPFEKAAYTEGEVDGEEGDTEKESFIGGGVGYGYGVCPYRCMTSIFMREDVRPTFQAVVGTTSMVGVGTEVGTEEGMTA
jgi:hypothetical protein